MEKFYADNFEDLLKENADQFKMYPSKKVWQGIYNNVHPGTSWPSLAMSIVFIFTLVIIGPLNTQQSEQSYLTDIKENIQVQKNLLSQSNNNLSADSKELNDISGNGKQFVYKNKAHNQKRINSYPISNDKLNIAKDNSSISDDNNVLAANNNQNFNDKSSATADGENKELFLNDRAVSIKAEKPDLDLLPNFKTTIPLLNLTPISSLPANADRPVQIDWLPVTEENLVNIVEPSMLESKPGITTVPLLKNRKPSKIGWTYYVSPTVSYRNYSKHEASNANEILSNLIYTVRNPDFKRSSTHRPSPGIEVGTAMKYSLSNKIKLTSGLQINYSAYTIQANNIHPMMSSLLLYNEKTAIPYAFSTISHYGNGPGSRQAHLHNYSLQLSLPVGLEFKIAGNDYMQLLASASFQPSFAVANQAYLLSTDKKLPDSCFIITQVEHEYKFGRFYFC